MPRRLIVIGQPRGPASREESARERLQRIGPARVANAVKAVRHLAQLGNPNVYDLRPIDRQKIVTTLKAELDQLDYALAHPGKAAPLVTFEDDAEK